MGTKQDEGDGQPPRAQPRRDDLDLRAIRSQLQRAVSQVCPGWLASQVEDITQSALLKVIDAVQGKGPRPLPRKYLVRAAYSATIDEIRRRRVRAHDVPNSAAIDTVGDEAHPEQTMQQADLGRDIQDCLAGVTEDRRRAVTLHLLGYDRQEIAAALQRPGKSTDNLIYRGLDDLRRCLRGKGHDR